MEPEWSKKISSNTICGTYYFIFVLYAIIASFAILGTLYALFKLKIQKGNAFLFGFQGLLTAVLAATLMLFQYLVCSRALLREKFLGYSIGGTGPSDRTRALWAHNSISQAEKNQWGYTCAILGMYRMGGTDLVNMGWAPDTIYRICGIA